MELAPQYYLGNLPSGEGKELLMELKQSLELERPSDEPSEGQRGHGEGQRGHGEADNTHCQPGAERCIIQ